MWNLKNEFLKDILIEIYIYIFNYIILTDPIVGKEGEREFNTLRWLKHKYYGILLCMISKNTVYSIYPFWFCKKIWILHNVYPEVFS